MRIVAETFVNLTPPSRRRIGGNLASMVWNLRAIEQMQSQRHLISTQAEAERLAQEQVAAEAKASDEADRIAAAAAKASDEADKEAKEAEEKADEAEEAVERETEGEGVLPTARNIGLGAVEQSDAVHESNLSRRVSALLNHDLHAIDATSAQPRCGLSPIDLRTGSEVCSARYNAHGRHLLLHMPVPKLIR